MREMRQSRLKLQRLRDNLFQTDEDRCLSDLGVFWNFVRSDPFTKPVVDELEGHPFDFDTWIAEAQGRRAYAFPSDERERAAMCLAILRPTNFASSQGIWGISFALGLQKPHTNKIYAATRAFFEVFLAPLHQYIDERLLERESMVAASDIMLEITQVVGEQTISRFPKTVEALQTAYRDLYSASGRVIWQNVGNSCRAALIAFAGEAYHPHMAPPDVSQPKGDDAKQKIVLALRHYWAQKSKRGPYGEALEVLVKATWDMTASLVHRKDATEHDAKACVMYTYLAVWNVAVISE